MAALYLGGGAIGAFAVGGAGMAVAGAACFVGGGLSIAIARAMRAREEAGRVLQEELQRRLHEDKLTGLMNRDAFTQALDDLADWSAQTSTVLVLFFDLDRFKDVNDTLGHKVGDLLLAQVAQRARGVLPEGSCFARLSGDEFAAIVPLMEGRRVEHLGDLLVEVMAEPFLIEGQVVQVSASVGIAAGDPALDDGHELLRRADVAMYEIKGTSRGGCRIFDDVLSGRQLRESSIRVELGNSLLENEFTLHYQPLVDARSGALASCEALLRPLSDGMRQVPISTLIMIAENSGQIMPLTEWTFGTALNAIRRLENTPVAVNVSPIYFRHPEFVHRIFDMLLQARVRPDLLGIEVTEGVLISEIDAARNAIHRLREIGVKVYLDDFGTGYSSLSYLQHFELDGLKLDRSFLREANDKSKATQIIRSVIDFGHSLDMSVVVEGVETDWQVRMLQLLGCDLLQGFEIGMPMALEELILFREQASASQMQKLAATGTAA
jgi:diguanylate cyclase (GGDEF)-like protein